MRIALTILTLGLSLWAIPALATSYHPNHAEDSRGTTRASAARSARESRQVNVDLRRDDKELASSYGRRAGRGAIHVRHIEAKDWKDQWGTKPGSVGSAIPEPSAMTLFGVGVVLALQAIPRRSARGSFVAERDEGPEHA